jgi:hypothetical protein
MFEHEQQHGYHHDTKVKPEAATAVIEPPMMGVRTHKTCRAANKHQDNKLEKLLQLVGDLFELYDDDARTYKTKFKHIVSTHILLNFCITLKMSVKWCGWQ